MSNTMEFEGHDLVEKRVEPPSDIDKSSDCDGCFFKSRYACPDCKNGYHWIEVGKTSK